MIGDAILYVVGLVLGGLGALLPTATLDDLPDSISGLGSTVGTMLGPINAFFPASELFTFLVLVMLVWFPAMMVYQTVFWIYKHIPIVGAG